MLQLQLGTTVAYNASVVVGFIPRSFFSKYTHQANRGAVKFYNAGIVTYDRRIGSWER
jgi:hypothetical protein